MQPEPCPKNASQQFDQRAGDTPPSIACTTRRGWSLAERLFRWFGTAHGENVIYELVTRQLLRRRIGPFLWGCVASMVVSLLLWKIPGIGCLSLLAGYVTGVLILSGATRFRPEMERSKQAEIILSAPVSDFDYTEAFTQLFMVACLVMYTMGLWSALLVNLREGAFMPGYLLAIVLMAVCTTGIAWAGYWASLLFPIGSTFMFLSFGAIGGIILFAELTFYFSGPAAVFVFLLFLGLVCWSLGSRLRTAADEVYRESLRERLFE